MADEPRPSRSLVPARLRVPEWLAGIAGLVLLIDLFLVDWYGAGGAQATGWTALSVLRWLLAVCGLGGIALALTQARNRAPAVPVTLSVWLAVLSLVASVALLIRVLDPPGGLDTRAGAVIGLAATAGLFAAGVASLRREGIRDADGPGEIPTVAI